MLHYHHSERKNFSGAWVGRSFPPDMRRHHDLFISQPPPPRQHIPGQNLVAARLGLGIAGVVLPLIGYMWCQ